MNKKTRSPLFHITKRDALPWYKSWGIRAAAILLALIVCSIITTTMTGENPLQVYATIFNGSFGSPPQGLGVAAEYRDASLYRARRDAGLQNALLEHRRRRSGSWPVRSQRRRA